MTTIKFKKATAYIDGGQGIVQLHLADHSEFPKSKKFTMQMQDKVYSAKLDVHHEKRSLDANAKAWKLCDELGKKLGITKEEVYKHHIKQVGVCITLKMKQEESETFIKAWQSRGIGWFVEITDTDYPTMYITAYYGSSMYDVKQMSRLLENIIIDCKEQDIETMSPDELDRLMGRWEQRCTAQNKN